MARTFARIRWHLQHWPFVLELPVHFERVHLACCRSPPVLVELRAGFVALLVCIPRGQTGRIREVPGVLSVLGVLGVLSVCTRRIGPRRCPECSSQLEDVPRRLAVGGCKKRPPWGSHEHLETAEDTPTEDAGDWYRWPASSSSCKATRWRRDDGTHWQTLGPNSAHFQLSQQWLVRSGTVANECHWAAPGNPPGRQTGASFRWWWIFVLLRLLLCGRARIYCRCAPRHKLMRANPSMAHARISPAVERSGTRPNSWTWMCLDVFDGLLFRCSSLCMLYHLDF